MHCPRQRLLLLALLALSAAPLSAQTIDDGLMMPKGRLCTGFGYTYDAWDRYWEGSLERDNGNVGTVSAHNVGWMGTYGITDGLNVIAMLPWVATSASAGPLAGMDGVQDLTVGLKWRALRTPLTSKGRLEAFLVASAGTPVGDYTPDFLPMSIGLGSSRASGRLTLDWESEPGIFLQGTGAYTWRGNVELDRDAYWDGGRLVYSNEVAMPDVIDYSFRVGYWKHGIYLPVSFTQQITQGGPDIRRQDMPFVNNRMNVSRVDVLARYYLPPSRRLSFHVGASRVVSGRNVGKSTAFTAGILYIFAF